MVNITIKHNLSYLAGGTDNALWGAMVEVNNATSHFLAYGLAAFIFIVLSYTFINKTQDIGKSLVSSLFITTIITLVMYYAGKTTGIMFISDVFMLGLATTTILSVAGLYYARTNTSP